MIKEDISWINNIRGLAIIAVVIGHISSPLTAFIYSWHIPLFFFVSGTLIRPDRPLLKSTSKDFYKLMVPYFTFSILGLIVEYLKRFTFTEYEYINDIYSLWENIVGIFLWMDFTHLHHYGFVLWFLPALFWAKTMHRLISRIINNAFIITAIYALMLISISGQSWILPFCIDKALIGIFWTSLGWLLTGKYWRISLILLLLIPIPNTNIAVKIISPYGLIYSLIAINSLVGISKLLKDKSDILNQFGKRTLLILITHPYLNNIVYLGIIHVLKLNWFTEAIVILLTYILIFKMLVILKSPLNMILKERGRQI